MMSNMEMTSLLGGEDGNTGQTLLISPEANLLNDSPRGLDHLNHSVLASALAHKIEDAEPPITVGIFARWGSGKSQLLKQIQDLLKKKERQKEADAVAPPRTRRCRRIPFACALSVILIILFFIVIATMWTVNPNMFFHFDNVTAISNETEGVSPESSHPIHHSHISRFIALGVLLIFVIIVASILFCSKFFQCLVHPRLLCYAIFTKLPEKKSKTRITRATEVDGIQMQVNPEAKKKTDKNTRFIFVDFNAWEYAGSDSLWAAIVTNLSRAIEAEFGIVTSRLFRLITVEAMQNSKSSNDVTNSLKIFLPGLRDREQNDLKKIMEKYGVVKRCGVKEGGWCDVQYSDVKEADRAFEALKLNGVKVERSNKIKERNKTACPHSSPGGDYSSPGNRHRAMFCHFLSHCCENPKKTCGMSVLGWWLLGGISVAAILIVIVVLAGDFHLDVYRFGRAVPVVVQIIAWAPPSLAVAYVVVRFLLAVCQSNTNRVNRALKGANGSVVDELGFMNKVKYEVQLMTEIVRCAEFVFNRKYRVVISIDDLDRVDLDKVKSVLDAVNILLSDQHAPFVCLIAVDSRIAIKSVEEKMSDALLQSNLNGHEYLKKVINLPFCLPPISDRAKKQYIYALVTWSDEVKHEQQDTPPVSGSSSESEIPEADAIEEAGSEENIRLLPQNGVNSVRTRSSARPDRSFRNITADARRNDVTDSDSRDPAHRRPPSPPYNDEPPLTHETFTVECRTKQEKRKLFRKFLYNDSTTQSYLHGNPRNIKRIFNVLSLTLWVLYYQEAEKENERVLKRMKKSSQDINENETSEASPEPSSSEQFSLPRTEQMARDLVTWVVLTDQWPYSMSYILHIIEDHICVMNMDNIRDSDSLSLVFEKHVFPKLQSSTSNAGALSCDMDVKVLRSYLLRTESSLSVAKAKLLKQISINLDQSLMQTIQGQKQSSGTGTTTNTSGNESNRVPFTDL